MGLLEQLASEAYSNSVLVWVAQLSMTVWTARLRYTCVSICISLHERSRVRERRQKDEHDSFAGSLQ